MPAKNSVTPSQLPHRIHQWLTENPGSHRTRDVATGLGIPEGMTRSEWVQKVGNAMAREYRRGTLVRSSRVVDGRAKPITTYELSPAPATV